MPPRAFNPEPACKEDQEKKIAQAKDDVVSSILLLRNLQRQHVHYQKELQSDRRKLAELPTTPENEEEALQLQLFILNVNHTLQTLQKQYEQFYQELVKDKKKLTSLLIDSETLWKPPSAAGQIFICDWWTHIHEHYSNNCTYGHPKPVSSQPFDCTCHPG